MTVIIYCRFYFKLPTPLGLILKPLKIPYWSAGLTTASIKLIKLDFTGAYRTNRLIYLVLIVFLIHIFVEPVIKNRNK